MNTEDSVVENVPINGTVNGTVNVPVNVLVNVPVKMSDMEKKVYAEIVNNNDITREIIANNIGVNIKTVARAINTLKDKRVIKRVGSDKTGHWEICK